MTNLQKITQSYQRHNLLILWADTPFSLPWHTPAQPAQALSQWQRAAAQLPPPDVPLWELPPLPILSLDPTARLENAFEAAGVPRKPVITREDVRSRGVHSLLKLAGDLPSRRAVVHSRADIRELAGNAEKRYLLTEAQHVLGGQGAVLVIGSGAEFATWWPVVQSALGNPGAFALGAAVNDIPALGVDFDELLAELRQIYRHQSQKETSMDAESLKKQLAIHHRRLGKLKEKAAMFGANTAPEILLEIEDIEAKIAELEGKIAPQTDSDSSESLPTGGTVYNTYINNATGLAIGDGAKVDLPPEGGLSDKIDQLQKRISTLNNLISHGFEELKRGQSVIYQQISKAQQSEVERILAILEQGKIEQNTIKLTLDAIRRALRAAQTYGLPMDADSRKYLEQMTKEVDSHLGLERKFELALPVLPFLVYKIELGVGNTVDLNAIANELRQHWQSLLKNS